MGKAKKVKRLIADAVHLKKSTQTQTPKKINPFEVHVNKEKFKILGRKCKHDRGLPGVSRGKAMKKRKSTLGKEFKLHNKTNKFTDNRIGRNSFMNDDLANARFTAEQQLAHFNKSNKKDLFNLNDDDMLTHKGQTIEEIEQFKDSLSEGSDDDEVLDAEYTETAHFGGGDDDRGNSDRKTDIEDMIAEAKRKKAEILKDKDEIYQLTNRLDENYKNLIPLMGKLSKNVDDPKAKPDDYDKALREMIFEPRGDVADKLKSEEEIAKKEKQRLEQLENERLTRMRGDEPELDSKPKHRSADDLDDGYFAGSDMDEDQEGTLAYDMNGESNLNEKLQNAQNELELEDLNENGITQEEQSGDENGDEEGQEEESENDDESEDDLGDLKFSDSEISDTEKEIAKKELSNSAITYETPNKKQKTSENSKEKSKCKAAKELPFTFEMPSSLNELSNLLSSQLPEYQSVIVERIIKCNHPKLDGSNRVKVAKLFEFLLEIITEDLKIATKDNIQNSFRKLDRLTPHIFDLVQLNPELISKHILELLKNRYEIYKKRLKKFPDLDIIILFKIISNLFSTSDFRHPVVTPSFIFISHILSNSRTKSRKDISLGLFIVTIALEFTQLSKRFIPSVFNYLLGIIFLAIPKRPIETLKIIPPFEPSGTSSCILALNGPAKNIKLNLLTAEDLVSDDEVDDNFKVLAINTTLQLIKDGIEVFSENVGARFIAKPFMKMLDRLNIENYPDFVKMNFVAVQAALIGTNDKSLVKLAPVARKPKALRLLEPRIEKVYDDKRRPKMSKEKEMRAIMNHKIKRETKGAVREIRRDTDFLQKMRIKKQLQSDVERREKVRLIYAEASVQQGELNALDRQRKGKGKF